MESSVRVQLLGPLTIRHAGDTLSLPSSRKVRALVAYLALASRPVTRAHLCELLGDIADDPKGELRWCLGKIRGLFDEPDTQRVQTPGESISLELDRSPQLNAWITAQRRRFNGCHAAVLEQLVKVLPADSPEVFGVLERHGRAREGADHLDATLRLFEAEGLDARPLRATWQAAMKRNGGAVAADARVSTQMPFAEDREALFRKNARLIGIG